MMKKAILFVALVCSVASGTAWTETFNVGYYWGGFPPFFFDREDERKGIFVEILDEVGRITGDRFPKKYYPVIRVKKMFLDGRIDVEPGICPLWRSDQKSVSVYTKSFYRYREIVGIRNEKYFPVNNVKDLKGISVGVVLGYEYGYTGWDADTGGYIPVECVSERELFKMFRAGRFDVFLSGSAVTSFYKNEFDLNIKEACEMRSADISFRFHISKKSAIDRINKALDKLNENGVIDGIIKKYTE